MDKYVKIVYQTPPIGPDKIVLYLTTFDKEAFERDQQLLPAKEQMVFEVDKYDIRDADFIERFEQNLNTIVKEYYISKLQELKQKDVKDVTNAEDIHCNIIYGDVTNCENIYCNEIKGEVVNCEKIIYRNK